MTASFQHEREEKNRAQGYKPRAKKSMPKGKIPDPGSMAHHQLRSTLLLHGDDSQDSIKALFARTTDQTLKASVAKVVARLALSSEEHPHGAFTNPAINHHEQMISSADNVTDNLVSFVQATRKDGILDKAGLDMHQFLSLQSPAPSPAPSLPPPPNKDQLSGNPFTYAQALIGGTNTDALPPQAPIIPPQLVINEMKVPLSLPGCNSRGPSPSSDHRESTHDPTAHSKFSHDRPVPTQAMYASRPSYAQVLAGQTVPPSVQADRTQARDTATAVNDHLSPQDDIPDSRSGSLSGMGSRSMSLDASQSVAAAPLIENSSTNLTNLDPSSPHDNQGHKAPTPQAPHGQAGIAVMSRADKIAQARSRAMILSPQLPLISNTKFSIGGSKSDLMPESVKASLLSQIKAQKNMTGQQVATSNNPFKDVHVYTLRGQVDTNFGSVFETNKVLPAQVIAAPDQNRDPLPQQPSIGMLSDPRYVSKEHPHLGSVCELGPHNDDQGEPPVYSLAFWPHQNSASNVQVMTIRDRTNPGFQTQALQLAGSQKWLTDPSADLTMKRVPFVGTYPLHIDWDSDSIPAQWIQKNNAKATGRQYMGTRGLLDTSAVSESIHKEFVEPILLDYSFMLSEALPKAIHSMTTEVPSDIRDYYKAGHTEKFITSLASCPDRMSGALVDNEIPDSIHIINDIIPYFITDETNPYVPGEYAPVTPTHIGCARQLARSMSKPWINIGLYPTLGQPDLNKDIARSQMWFGSAAIHRKETLASPDGSQALLTIPLPPGSLIIAGEPKHAEADLVISLIAPDWLAPFVSSSPRWSRIDQAVRKGTAVGKSYKSFDLISPSNENLPTPIHQLPQQQQGNTYQPASFSRAPVTLDPQSRPTQSPTMIEDTRASVLPSTTDESLALNEWVGQFLPHQLAAMLTSSECLDQYPKGTEVIVQKRLRDFNQAPIKFWSYYISSLNVDELMSIRSNSSHYPANANCCVKQALLKNEAYQPTGPASNLDPPSQANAAPPPVYTSVRLDNTEQHGSERVPSYPHDAPSILPSQQDQSPSKIKSNPSSLVRSVTLQRPSEMHIGTLDADAPDAGSGGPLNHNEGTLSSSSGTQLSIDSANRESAVAQVLIEAENRCSTLNSDVPHNIRLRRACIIAAFMERRTTSLAELEADPKVGSSLRIDELDTEIANRFRWIDNRVDSPYPGDDEHVFKRWNLSELDAYLALFPAALELTGKPASSANPSPAALQLDQSRCRARTKASIAAANGREGNIKFIKSFAGVDPEQVLRRSNKALIGMSTNEKLRELITSINTQPSIITDIIQSPDKYPDDVLNFMVIGLTTPPPTAEEAVAIPTFHSHPDLSAPATATDDPPPIEWIERFLPHQLVSMFKSNEAYPAETRDLIRKRLEEYEHAPASFWSHFASQLTVGEMHSISDHGDCYPPEAINCVRQAMAKSVQSVAKNQPAIPLPNVSLPANNSPTRSVQPTNTVVSLSGPQPALADSIQEVPEAPSSAPTEVTPLQNTPGDHASTQANQLGSALIEVLGIPCDEGTTSNLGWTELERAQERLRIYNQLQKHNHLRVMPAVRTALATITHGNEAYRRLLKLSIVLPDSPWSPLVTEGLSNNADRIQKPPLMKVVEIRLEQLQSTRRNLDSAEWGDKARLQQQQLHEQTQYLEALHDYQNGRVASTRQTTQSTGLPPRKKNRPSDTVPSTQPVNLLDLLPHQLGSACVQQPDLVDMLDQATEILDNWKQSVDSPQGKADWVHSLKRQQLEEIYDSHQNGNEFYHNEIFNLAAARLSLIATAVHPTQPPVETHNSTRNGDKARSAASKGAAMKRGRSNQPNLKDNNNSRDSKSKRVRTAVPDSQDAPTNQPKSKRSRNVLFAEQTSGNDRRRLTRTLPSFLCSLSHHMTHSILPSCSLPLPLHSTLTAATELLSTSTVSHTNLPHSYSSSHSPFMSPTQQHTTPSYGQPSSRPHSQWHVTHFSRHNASTMEELNTALHSPSILPSSEDLSQPILHSDTVRASTQPAIPSRAHVKTHNARHAALEESLYELWLSTIEVSAQEKTYNFHLDHLTPLFEALGLLEGSTRLGWIDELQEFRHRTDPDNSWDKAASSITGQQLALMPYLGDAAIVSTDGSSKDAAPIRNNTQIDRSMSRGLRRTKSRAGADNRRNRPLQTSGSGVVFHADPLRPIAFRSATTRQDNDVGEIDAATASRHRAGSQLDILILTDAQRVRTLINITLPTWQLLPPSTRIAKHVSVIVLYVLITLAAGNTHALKFPAHAPELSFNQVADQLANTGATKTRSDSKLIKRLNFSKAIMFIRTFEAHRAEPQFQTIINPLAHDHTLMFSQRDPRWTPSLRFAVGSSPVKEESVRTIMGPILSHACTDLMTLVERAEQCLSPSQPSSVVNEIRESFQEITERVDSALWEVVVSQFGLRIAEAGPHSNNNPNSSRFHSAEFNGKVAELSELNTAIDNAAVAIHSVQGINLPDVDQLHSLSFADHADFQLALTTICKVLVHSRPNCLSDACKIIEVAKEYAANTGQELKMSAAADREQHSMSKGFGLWRNRQLRQYFKHVINRSIIRKPHFNVDPCVYLESLTDKVLPACFPPATGVYDASLTPISPISLMALNAPRSVAEIEALLMKAREQSAPSPLRQISYKMWQMLLPQHFRNQIRSARKLLVQKWKEDTAILDDGIMDEFMYWESSQQQDVTELFTDSEDEEQEVKEGVTSPPSGINMAADKSVAVYILTIVQLVELLAWIPLDFTQFCVRPLFKPKPSAYTNLSDAEFEDTCQQVSKFREVMLANSCIRKLVGGVVSRRGLDFIETNRINLGIQVGYIPGFDPSRLNHCRTNICRFWTSIHSSASEVLILYDWVSFFSFLTPQNMKKAYDFLQLPHWMINILNALGAPKDVFYTSGGQVHGPSIMKCDAQGCPESCFNAIAVSCAFCARMSSMNAGFSLPDFSSKAPKVNAMMQVDDLKILVGGAEKTAQQVADEATLLSQEVIRFQRECGFMAQVSNNPLKSKTVAAVRMRTDLGQESSIKCTLSTLTKDGQQQIPLMLADQAHSDLGVMVHSEHQRTAGATYAKALSVIQERASVHLQSDLPSQGRLYSLWVSVLGGAKWLANMGQYIPIALAEQLTNNCIDMVKRTLSLSASSSTAIIFVPKLQFGIGFPHFTQTVMGRALVNVITDKASRSDDMIQWSWYELEFAREVNGIPKVDMHAGGFFDWDTSLITSKSVLSMPFQCGHTWACAACIDAGFRTVEIESTNGPRIAIVPCSDLSSLHRSEGIASDTRNCITGKARINKIVKRSFANHWLQKASGQMALRFFQVRGAFHSGLSNAWRSDSSLKDSAFKWCIKACSGQLVTPAVVCSRWGAIESPACPMPNCSWNWCDDKHILQRCAWNKSKITLRHDKCKGPFLEFINNSCTHWRYIGEPDCAPPAHLIQESWKEDLAMLLPDREHLPLRPDVVLADDLVYSKLRVRIVDFKIAWDANMTEDSEVKVKKYQPLADMITRFCTQRYGHTPDVRVVPIVIGTCGSIPADWYVRMADLEATEAGAAKIAKTLSTTIIEESSNIFYGWTSDARAHGF